MREDEKLIKIGGVCGIIAFVLLGSAFLLNNVLPGHGTETTEEFLSSLSTARNGTLLMNGYFIAAAYGLLGIVALLGLHRLLTNERSSLAATVGVIYGCIAFSLVAAMLIVQGTVMARMGSRFATANETERQTIITIYRSLRSVDLGLDLVWDVFICISFLLFGISMFRSRYFGAVFGITGILIGVALLTLNMATAPTPPASAGLIDLGPLAGVWFLAISIQLLRKAKFAAKSSRYSV